MGGSWGLELTPWPQRKPIPAVVRSGGSLTWWWCQMPDDDPLHPTLEPAEVATVILALHFWKAQRREQGNDPLLSVIHLLPRKFGRTVPLRDQEIDRLLARLTSWP